jgi:DNA repair protein RadA/Sms
MKVKTTYQCSTCDHQEPKWMGRCPSCGSWNTFGEVGTAPTRGQADADDLPLPLEAIEATEHVRLPTGLEEIDRVLGGGLVRGSVVLVGGEPGIGKSTLMLELAASVQTAGRILYVSGEESPGQLRMRAERCGLVGAGARGRTAIEILAATELASIEGAIERLRPVLVIVDSIQTVHTSSLPSPAGTVNQIRACATTLGGWAKRTGSALFLVGHVTKEGTIAGPKVVEHMVDTVLYFDEASTDVRFLRSTKNRYGSTDEIAILRMTDTGLEQVSDPRLLFLAHRDGVLPPGIAVAPVYEGSRVLLVEIQSLVVPAKAGAARVYSDRIDAGRVSRTAAVLEKHAGVTFSDRDVYVNVAGGIRVTEVAIELPLAMALYSARTGLPLPPGIGITGEVSLAGEVREVTRLERRVRTMAETGYATVVGPVAHRDAPAAVTGAGAPGAQGTDPSSVYRGVALVRDAVSFLFGRERAGLRPSGAPEIAR